MSSEDIYYKRAFLNTAESGGTAYIEASVGALTDRQYINAQLKIADCSRIVTLDFDVYDDTANVRAKVLLLRRIVATFTDALIAQLDEKDRA